MKLLTQKSTGMTLITQSISQQLTLPSADAGVPALSLSADKLTAAKDEEVVLSVNAENLPTEKFVSGHELQLLEATPPGHLNS